MLARSVVIVLEGITILAAATLVFVWLALVGFLVATLVRVWRGSESADPFEWLAYMRSPQATDVVHSLQLGRRLVRFGFLCVVISAIAGVAAAICATVFHVP
jgi:hypothetical protein